MRRYPRIVKAVFEIDGTRCETLDQFYDEITRALGVSEWGRNLDAFNDILRGGFGTPDGGFVLRWRSSQLASQHLGYPETVRYLERKVTRCHPSNVASVTNDIAAARRGEGQTLFEILVEIIRDHGPEGAQRKDGVELELL